MIPSLTDLGLFWPLLSTFGTGQKVTVYNTIVTGPRQAKLFAGKKMKRGAPDGSPPGREKTYAGAGVSPEVKDHTARLAVALQARGVSMSVILSALSDTDYAPAPRTLREHMAAIKGSEAPLSAEKGSGRPSVVTDEEWAIVFGRVLRQTKPVGLEWVQQWIKVNLGIDVSIATVSRHKDEMGLSFQFTGSRGMKPGSTFSAILTLFVASNRPGSLTTTANASSVLISSPTACASSDRRPSLYVEENRKSWKNPLPPTPTATSLVCPWRLGPSFCP